MRALHDVDKLLSRSPFLLENGVLLLENRILSAWDVDIFFLAAEDSKRSQHSAISFLRASLLDKA